MPINESSPIKSRNQIKIQAPIDTVWFILTDFKNWTKWQWAVTETIVEESLQGVFPKLFKKYFQDNLDKGVLTNLTELKVASEMRIK